MSQFQFTGKFQPTVKFQSSKTKLTQSQKKKAYEEAKAKKKAALEQQQIEKQLEKPRVVGEWFGHSNTEIVAYLNSATIKEGKGDAADAKSADVETVDVKTAGVETADVEATDDKAINAEFENAVIRGIDSALGDALCISDDGIIAQKEGSKPIPKIIRTPKYLQVLHGITCKNNMQILNMYFMLEIFAFLTKKRMPGVDYVELVKTAASIHSRTAASIYPRTYTENISITELAHDVLIIQNADPSTVYFGQELRCKCRDSFRIAISHDGITYNPEFGIGIMYPVLFCNTPRCRRGRILMVFSVHL